MAKIRVTYTLDNGFTVAGWLEEGTQMTIFRDPNDLAQQKDPSLGDVCVVLPPGSCTAGQDTAPPRP